NVEDLPLDPYGIRFLPLETEGGVPYDFFMLLGLHSLWRTRTEVNNADVKIRPAGDHLIESAAYIREVYRGLQEPPDWVSLLDEL
ncbi:uncharacterized protein ISCGN_006117, partial [Ixodes scapularis]